jgi:hypothetical protein
VHFTVVRVLFQARCLIENVTRRKYALWILNKKTVLAVGGETIKLKLAKRKARLGKKTYSDEVIVSLRLIWIFFWNKCGGNKLSQILALLMRQQMPFRTFYTNGTKNTQFYPC